MISWIKNFWYGARNADYFYVLYKDEEARADYLERRVRKLEGMLLGETHMSELGHTN